LYWFDFDQDEDVDLEDYAWFYDSYTQR
jgi:hypothetical protein